MDGWIDEWMGPDTLCWQLVELYWASALLLRAGKRELEDNAGKAAVVGKLLSRVFGRTLSRVVEAVWGEKAIAARISGLRAEAERYDRRMDLIIEDLAKRQQENDLNGTATLAMLEQAEREFCATMAMVQTHPDKYRPRKGDDPWGVTRQAFSKFSRQNAWHSIYYIRRRAPNAPLPLLMKQKERAREMKEWTERRGAPWGTSEDTQEVLELYEQQLKEADERIKERLEAIGVAEPAIDTQRTAASNKTSNRTTDELL